MESMINEPFLNNHTCSYLQEDTTVSVHIRPWVLGLALLQEDVRHDLVQLGDQFEQGVIREVLQGKLSLAGVAGVCLPQHCMAIAGDNL